MKVGVNQHTTAVLTYHYLFVLAYLTLFLRGNRIETTTTGISFNLYNGQTIAITMTDLTVTGQQSWVNRVLCLSGHFIKMLFFLFSGSNDLFKFFLFCVQDSFLRGNCLFSFLEQHGFFCDLIGSILDVLFSELYFQLLHLDFLIDRFKLTIILYVVTLLLVFFYQSSRFFDRFLLLLNKFCNTIDLFFNTGLSCMKALYLIFKISYLHRQLALQYF